MVTATAANRFAAILLGGFAFAYGFVALAILGGFSAGLEFHTAESLAWMLSFLVYLAAILWGFAARSAARVWVALLGGGAAMAGAAWALSRTML